MFPVKKPVWNQIWQQIKNIDSYVESTCQKVNRKLNDWQTCETDKLHGATKRTCCNKYNFNAELN